MYFEINSKNNYCYSNKLPNLNYAPFGVSIPKYNIIEYIYLSIKNIIYYYKFILLYIQYEDDNRRHDCEWYSRYIFSKDRMKT